jgi:hypothetical protein
VTQNVKNNNGLAGLAGLIILVIILILVFTHCLKRRKNPNGDWEWRCRVATN